VQISSPRTRQNSFQNSFERVRRNRQGRTASRLNVSQYSFLISASRKVRCRLSFERVHDDKTDKERFEVRRYYASFSYRAGSWTRSRRVVAKVEWHPGELYPRVGFIVTNLARPAERVVAFYNQRGTAEQWIKEGKGAIKWTRLSCRTFDANAVRLQLHTLAYNLGNFMRTLALPKAAAAWSLTSLAREAGQDRRQGRQPRPLTWGGSGQGGSYPSDISRSPASVRHPRSEPACMTRRVSEHDQTHIRSPLAAAAPRSRLRRTGLRKTRPFYVTAL
jgi:Transposase DDE domain group 1